jgi:DNA adenine methylase
VDLLVEPFAGGASTSLRLAGAGIVHRVLLADADLMVASFWQAAAAQTDELIDRISDEHHRYVARGGSTALGRWDYWRAWRPETGQSPTTARLGIAVKCLFLNRTTFSGILHGRAGPIGGRQQHSRYDIGCRFNLEALTDRLRFVRHLYDTRRLVDVWCTDWRRTLEDVAEWYPTLLPSRVVAYLDPPYLCKSGKLYPRSANWQAPATTDDLEWHTPNQHVELAAYLRRQIRFRWILSYDASPHLLQDEHLYAAKRMVPSMADRRDLGVKAWPISKRLVTLNYTASARNGRGPASELLLTTLPHTTVPANDRLRPVPPGSY